MKRFRRKLARYASFLAVTAKVAPTSALGVILTVSFLYSLTISASKHAQKAIQQSTVSVKGVKAHVRIASKQSQIASRAMALKIVGIFTQAIAMLFAHLIPLLSQMIKNFSLA